MSCCKPMQVLTGRQNCAPNRCTCPWPLDPLSHLAALLAVLFADDDGQLPWAVLGRDNQSEHLSAWTRQPCPPQPACTGSPLGDSPSLLQRQLRNTLPN